MGEIVIMGVGIDSPTVTLPMSATKEEIVGALLATCSCVSYDKDTDEWGVAPECWGDCNEEETQP